MANREAILVRKCSWGRGISDVDWERLDPAHIALWRDAQLSFFPRKLIADDRCYLVTADLEPAISSLQQSYSAMRRLYPDRGAPDSDAFASFPEEKDCLLFHVRQQSEDNSLNNNLAEYLVQSALFDLFMVLHLSGPGSCNLYKAEIGRDGSTKVDELRLSNYHFEAAGLVDSWPVIGILPFRQVLAWFDIVRTNTSQVAQSSTEKVLFSLWHISQEDTSPVAIIWIFYALETLLCSQPGDSFSVLKRRLEVLLRPSNHEASMLKKKLRTLYDLRSSFVHGGSGMFHPMRNEVLDKRADEQYSIYSESIEFGMLLIVKILQTMVNLKVAQLTFRETLDFGA